MKKEELKALVDKIQSMTGKEIILTMVESLRNPVTRIDMSTFGLKDIYAEKGPKGICYGCAATNLICKLGNFNPVDVIDDDENRLYRDVSFEDDDEIRVMKDIVNVFEWAIDSLRCGHTVSYNEHAKGYFALIPPMCGLPYLEDRYTKEELQQYEDFANTL